MSTTSRKWTELYVQMLVICFALGYAIGWLFKRAKRLAQSTEWDAWEEGYDAAERRARVRAERAAEPKRELCTNCDHFDRVEGELFCAVCVESAAKTADAIDAARKLDTELGRAHGLTPERVEVVPFPPKVDDDLKGGK